MDTPPMFNSVEDECRYWKERAKLYHKEWTDAKQEFDEFVEDSRQLESEMETTLEQKENVIRDLRKQIIIIEKENESLRIKLDSIVMEFGNMEKQFLSSQHDKDNLKKYLRQLEQQNDDLERGYRILSESIAGVKTDLDKAYEKNALLEIEVDEKEVLQEKLQRLMDETRDLKQELHVKERHPTSTINGLDKRYLNTDEDTLDSHSQIAACSASDISQHSLKHPAENMLSPNSLTASSRTTALNIVADMLRKLNLDKRLLCSRCDKFRCICESSLQNNLSTCTSSVTSATSSNYNVSTSNFGSNVFKRLSQKVTGITSDDPNNAMESKLKGYREQVPAPRQ